MKAILTLALVVGALANSPLSQSTSPSSSADRVADSTTLTLTGRVTVADKGTYQEHPFEVPAGVTRLDVEFSYENQNAGTELEVGLFDTDRFRGTSRFSKQRFHVTEFDATPSYVPGPIGRGRWRLSVGVPSIGANMTTEWRAVIRMSTAATPREGFGPTLRDEPGWYAGDLHAHTLHSDGYGCEDPGRPGIKRGCQPWEVVEAARSRQLDFLAVTDHNTTSHHADLATLQESLTTLLLMRGQELTTFRGHANVYGTSRPVDFRLGFRGRAMADVVSEVATQGAILSINHPGRETGDRCTGCGWDAPLTPWDRIEAIEVVNGRVIEGRAAGMPFWYARLNEGHRITGIGGGDEHGVRPNGRVGSPTTVIFAEALSEAALLAGIRSGRVYVRTRGPEGPALDLTATTADRTASMGGVLRLGGAAPLQLGVKIERAAGQQAEIVIDGRLVQSLDVPAETSNLSVNVTMAPGQWLHLRLRDAMGITAFTNPIYARPN